MEIAAETVEKLASAVEQLTQKLGRMEAMQNDLWGAEEIADHLKLKVRSVQQAIINRKRNPSFPAPKILPTGGRRWERQQVIEWSKNR